MYKKKLLTMRSFQLLEGIHLSDQTHVNVLQSAATSLFTSSAMALQLLWQQQQLVGSQFLLLF